MECIFCKIVKKEIASDIVWENDTVLVFKDIHPKAPIHLLVVPKIHIQSIAHLEAEHQEITCELIYAAKLVAEKLGLTGYKLVFNVGREGGQIIDHLHLHLLGGWDKEKNPDRFRV